jgi:DNA-binding SARP family transcriptional activator
VREFAHSAWPLTSEETQSIRARAASWFESEGRLPEALATLAAASGHDEIARLLEAHGPELLRSGDGHVVTRLAAELPLEARSAAIEQLLGEALLMQGELDEALAAFERAAGERREIDAGLAWRIGMAHHFRGSLRKALEIYAQAGEGGAGPYDARMLAWAAGANAILNEPARALALATQALELATRCRDDRALAAAHSALGVVRSREGRFTESDRHLDAALEAAERARDLILLSRIRTNRAAGFTARGFYRLALAELDEAMALGELPGFTQYGRSLTNRANTRVRLGLLDEAGADFAAIIELSRPRGGVEAGLGHIGIADVHRERGNLALARTGYELGLELLTDSERSAGEPAALAGLARVLVDESPEAARQAAERAVELETWFPAAALNSAGWVALALGDDEGARAAATEAQGHARALHDRYGLAEALALEALASEQPAAARDRLEEALSIWRDLECRVRIAECELALAGLASGAEARAAQERAERRLRALGVRVSASAPAGLMRSVARRNPAPALVQVLGGFAVLRDGEPVALSEWKTKKPRELLKILVCRRGRPVPRELVMEALWPEDEPQLLANRLSVALSTLRSVLDPQRRFDAEQFVKADRESIVLDLNNVLVDVEVFLHEAETGLSLRAGGNPGEAREGLEQAEAAYAGDVLEEDPYSEWALSLREDARATYISLAHALARDAWDDGHDDDALRYFLRVLGRDPYDEGAHLGVVATLERGGRRGEARRSYRAYVARMGEIGATPAAFPATSS